MPFLTHGTAGTISREPVSQHDHAATTRFHLRLAEHHASLGQHDIAEKHRVIAAKYEKKAKKHPYTPTGGFILR